MRENDLDFYGNNAVGTYNISQDIRYQLKILDSLDAFTLKHSENVARLTNKICEEMNFTEDFTIYCTMCAYVHDVRKNVYSAINSSKGRKTYR